MESKSQSGYLVFADISGYTSYMAATEIEHAQAVLGELMELLVDRITALLHLSVLEGDAAFAYISDEEVPRGETLLELMESTYGAFRDRVASTVRRTTCECNACRAIPGLDLKFIIVHGTYVKQAVAGMTQLVGSDVNLVHRLSKNHVSEMTGWHGYVLFPEETLRYMGIWPKGLFESEESYEHLGLCKTYSMNLRARYEEMASARRVVVSPTEAYLTLTSDIPLPPAAVWDILNDPAKREQCNVQANTRLIAVARPDGRTAPGARNHCLHGKKAGVVEDIVDWKPFDYATIESNTGSVKILATWQLEALAGGRHTRLHLYARGKTPIPEPLNRPVFKSLAGSIYTKYLANVQRLAATLAEERAGRPAAPAAPGAAPPSAELINEPAG